MMVNCEHCGKPLLDGGIDYYCENEECNLKDMASIYKQIVESREQKEYERLKAKYENVHSSTG